MGQAGELPNPTETATLRFNSHEDALRFVAESAQRAKRACLGYRLGFIERYINGNACLKISGRLAPEPKIYEFILASVPLSGQPHSTPEFKVINTYVDVPCEDGKRRQIPSVFLGISEIVYGPQGVIRSGLWLTRNQDIGDISVKIDVRFDFGLNLIGGIPKGEFNLLDPSDRGLRRDNRTIDGIVENIPYVGNSIERNAIQFVGNGTGKPDFVDILSGLRLFINDMGVLAVSEIQGGPDKKIVDMSVGIVECDPGPGKRIFRHETIS